MEALHLDVHGVRARLASGEPSALEPLARDFAYFAAPPLAGTPPPVDWTLHRRSPPPPPTGRPFFSTSEYRAFERGGERVVDYGGRALARLDRMSGRGELWCPDPALLHELSYLAVLSRVGEALDGAGLHRVHALGFESGGRGGLLLLPSGGGKSTLALELLRSSSVGILADDSTLVTRDGRLLAFPLRWGFQEDAPLTGVPEALVRDFPRRRYGRKRLVDVSFFRDRVRREVPLSWVFIGSRTGTAAPDIRPTGRAAAFAALARNLVVGEGVAQMSEYMLGPRPADAARLASIAWARTRAAWASACRAELRRFDLGPDAGENAAALLSALR